MWGESLFAGILEISMALIEINGRRSTNSDVVGLIDTTVFFCVTSGLENATDEMINAYLDSGRDIGLYNTFNVLFDWLKISIQLTVPLTIDIHLTIYNHDLEKINQFEDTFNQIGKQLFEPFYNEITRAANENDETNEKSTVINNQHKVERRIGLFNQPKRYNQNA